MAKVCGIETEYGIALRGGDPNPIAASSILINAYVQHLHRQVGWDFEDESPGRDARGSSRPDARPPEVETHLVNAVLTNGARYYVDHAHPEYSSPECRDAMSALLFDRAGEVILQRSMEYASALLQGDAHIAVYKNNSDGKGNSYGCHENYLMDRAIPFATIVRRIIPFFVTRQLFTGSGKVGSEAPGGDASAFQITQRADFFEEEVGLETTLKRPIVNTRDEPHADSQRYRRLHVICGDANLAEVATFLKLGATAMVLALIEDDVRGSRDIDLAAPVAAMRHVSSDLTLREALPLDDGTTMTAFDIQWEYLGLAKKWADEHGFEAIGGDAVGQVVIDRWETVLSGLETDPMTLADQLDWVAKYRLHRRVPRTQRHAVEQRPAAGHGYPVPRPAAGDVAVPPDEHGKTRRSSGCGRTRSANRRETPAPTSGASACKNGVVRWRRRTGIRSCSISVRIPCGACR